MSVSYANRPEPAAVPELLGSARFLAAASAATWVPRRKVHDRLLSTGRRKNGLDSADHGDAREAFRASALGRDDHDRITLLKIRQLHGRQTGDDLLQVWKAAPTSALSASSPLTSVAPPPSPPRRRPAQLRHLRRVLRRPHLRPLRRP